MGSPLAESTRPSTKNGPNTVAWVAPGGFLLLIPTTSIDTPRVSESRMNSWRLSSDMWPVLVRKSMARNHSSSVNPTSLTKACRCLMRLCMISLNRGDLLPSKLASTVSVSFSSARSRVLLAAELASRRSTSSPSLRLATALDYHGDALPDPYTHRGEPVSDLGAAPHLMHQRRQDACPRAPERMSEGYRPAVGVEPLVLRVHPPLVEHRQRLRRERLVQLDKPHVVKGDARPIQRFARGWHRTYAHDPRRDAHARHAPYLPPGLETVHLGVFRGHHEHCRCAVVEGAGVAGGHASTLLEGRFEVAQLLQGGVAPGTLVGLHHGLLTLAALDRDRNDLRAEPLLIYGGHGLLVAAQRETILGLPGDVVLTGEALRLLFFGGDVETLLGEVLGGHAEGVGVSHRLHPGVDEAPA